MYILPNMRSAICHISVPSAHCVMPIEAALPEGSETAEQHAQRSLAGSPRRLAATTANASPKRLRVNAPFCGPTALRQLGCWPFATTTRVTVLTSYLLCTAYGSGRCLPAPPCQCLFPLFRECCPPPGGGRMRRYSSRVPNAYACATGF